jgi:S-adenosylmethionine-diacylglycerol 3-amino-3-carboxypropyl transferase
MHDSSQLISHAVNARSITTPQGLLEHFFKLSFGGFVYNQIWEDPDVDAQALQLDADSRIMTISSAGCNVLNYLCRGVASVDAVDLNAHHLHLLKLKLLGLAHLPDHHDFFAFFGDAHNCENSARFRRHIRRHLNDAARRHWEGGHVRKRLRRERFRYFERGLYRHASVGRFLRFFHRIAHHKGMNPARLLECRTLAQQEAVFDREIAPFFDMQIVRVVTRLPFILHGIGVPPRQYEAFKNEVGAANVFQQYRARVKRLACQFPIQDNYFAWQAFAGRYDTIHRRAIPNYLQAKNFQQLRTSADRVKTHHTSMTGFLSTMPPSSLNRFVLLDSQDWMTPDQIHALWRQIRRVGQPGSRIIFRTGASRSPLEESLPAELLTRFTYHDQLSRDLFERDRSAIYGGFHLYVMKLPAAE